MPLEQAVGLGSVGDAMGSLAERGQPYDKAWELRGKALTATPSDLGRVMRGSILVGQDRRLAVAVDLDGADFLISVLDADQAQSQRITVPVETVLRNAPEGCTSTEQLARFLIASLEQDADSTLFPDAAALKLAFSP
jgi:hypothetical protein